MGKTGENFKSLGNSRRPRRHPFGAAFFYGSIDIGVLDVTVIVENYIENS